MIAACPQRHINSGLEITYHVVGGCPSTLIGSMLMVWHEVNNPYAVPEVRKWRMNQRPGSHAGNSVILMGGVFVMKM
nr:MAG TPA: hypothetical protein [Bacteriophage sp.]